MTDTIAALGGSDGIVHEYKAKPKAKPAKKAVKKKAKAAKKSKPKAKAKKVAKPKATKKAKATRKQVRTARLDLRCTPGERALALSIAKARGVTVTDIVMDVLSKLKKSAKKAK